MAGAKEWAVKKLRASASVVEACVETSAFAGFTFGSVDKRKNESSSGAAIFSCRTVYYPAQGSQSSFKNILIKF